MDAYFGLRGRGEHGKHDGEDDLNDMFANTVEFATTAECVKSKFEDFDEKLKNAEEKLAEIKNEMKQKISENNDLSTELSEKKKRLQHLKIS